MQNARHIIIWLVLFWCSGIAIALISTSLMAIGLVKAPWALLAALSNVISAFFGAWFIHSYFKEPERTALIGSRAINWSFWLAVVFGALGVISIITWFLPKMLQLSISLLIYVLFIFHDWLIRSGLRGHHLFNKTDPSENEVAIQNQLRQLDERINEWSNGINLPTLLLLCLLLGYSLVAHGSLPILNALGRSPNSQEAEVYLAGAVAFHLLLALYMFARENVSGFQNYVDLNT